MNWKDYVETHWPSLKMKYTVTWQNSRSWGENMHNAPRIRNDKLFVPDGLWKDAGYIDLVTHQIVENDGCTEAGRTRLQNFYELIESNCK